MPSTIRILKFESPTCVVCKALNKRRVTETLKEEFPSVEVITIQTNNANDEAPDGSIFEEGYNISEEMDIQALPVIVFTDDRGIELKRIEGGASMQEYRKTLTALMEDVQQQNAIGERVARYAALARDGV